MEVEGGADLPQRVSASAARAGEGKDDARWPTGRGRALDAMTRGSRPACGPVRGLKQRASMEHVAGASDCDARSTAATQRQMNSVSMKFTSFEDAQRRFHNTPVPSMSREINRFAGVLSNHRIPGRALGTQRCPCQGDWRPLVRSQLAEGDLVVPLLELQAPTATATATRRSTSSTARASQKEVASSTPGSAYSARWWPTSCWPGCLPLPADRWKANEKRPLIAFSALACSTRGHAMLQ